MIDFDVNFEYREIYREYIKKKQVSIVSGVTSGTPDRRNWRRGSFPGNLSSRKGRVCLSDKTQRDYLSQKRPSSQ
eukprot:g36396.t1